MTVALELSPETLDALAERLVGPLAERLAGKLPEAAPTSAILTKDEAIRISRCKSQSAFYRWCERWSVRPTTPGRYPLHRVNAGLQREALAGGRKRKSPAASSHA